MKFITSYAYSEDRIKSYIFGFNGQLKDNEVYGEGNSYTADYWEYDPRIARRWNLDPNPQINISDYAVMGNSPVTFSDKNGDTFGTDGDAKSNSDVKSTVREKYQHFVSIDATTNNVIVDFAAGKSDKRYWNKDQTKFNQKKYDKDVRNAKSDIGIKLIDNLASATENYLYSTSSTVQYRDRNSGVSQTEQLGGTALYQGPMGPVAMTDWGRTLSTTAHSSASPGALPQTGYDGTVYIIPGEFTSHQKVYDLNLGTIIKGGQPMARASIVFHELSEVYYRTHGLGMTRNAAHLKAIADEGERWGNLYPGANDNFIK